MPAAKSKQTAVEWLIKKLQNRQNGIFDGLPHLSLDEIYNQAKQMEKEQIEDAHIEGQRVFDKYPHTEWTNDQAELYYEQTYGKQNNKPTH